jgi:hypothetical protein
MIHIDRRVSAKALPDGYGILLHAYFIVRLGSLGCSSFDKEKSSWMSLQLSQEVRVQVSVIETEIMCECRLLSAKVRVLSNIE